MFSYAVNQIWPATIKLANLLNRSQHASSNDIVRHETYKFIESIPLTSSNDIVRHETYKFIESIPLTSSNDIVRHETYKFIESIPHASSNDIVRVASVVSVSMSAAIVDVLMDSPERCKAEIFVRKKY
jgi:hypothetical protein